MYIIYVVVIPRNSVSLLSPHLVFLQSQDEIEKLMVDEGLSEMERACLLLTSSHDVQRVWSIGRLVTLLRSDTNTTLQKFIPKLTVSDRIGRHLHTYQNMIPPPYSGQL